MSKINLLKWVPSRQKRHMHLIQMRVETRNKLKQQFKEKKDKDQRKECNPISTHESSNSKSRKIKKDKVICD
jgi:hypothetical protein